MHALFRSQVISSNNATGNSIRCRSQSDSRRYPSYPVETVHITTNRGDEVSVITDPKFARSVRDDNKMSTSKSVTWMLKGEQALERINDVASLYKSYLATQPGTVLGGRAKPGMQRRYPMDTVQVLPHQADAVSAITDPRYTKSAWKLPIDMSGKLTDVSALNGDDERGSDEGTLESDSSGVELMKMGFLTGQYFEEESRRNLEKERNEQVFANALKEKTPKEIAKILMQADEKREEQVPVLHYWPFATEKRAEGQELDGRNEDNENCAVTAKVGEARESDEVVTTYYTSITEESQYEPDDATAGDFSDLGVALEVKNESFTVKLISMDTNEDQEVIFVGGTTIEVAESDSFDNSTVMSAKETLAKTIQDLSRTGKSPNEIAEFLTKANEERVKAESEMMAVKKADENLVFMAIKKGMAPGQVASNIFQAEQEVKPIIKNDGVQEQEKGSSILTSPDNEIAGVYNPCKNEKDDEDTGSEASILTEKRAGLDIEIEKLKADLDKFKSKIKELGADIDSVDASKKNSFYTWSAYESHYDSDDEEDTSVTSIISDFEDCQQAGLCCFH